MTAALRRSGHRVVPFKKGPDYIDAGWMTTAAGHPCYNLDPYLMSDTTLADSFERQAVGADYALIEGNRGLYDGVTAEGEFSTADLAVQRDLPVLLVVNCSKTPGLLPLWFSVAESWISESALPGSFSTRSPRHAMSVLSPSPWKNTLASRWWASFRA
ncbi:CobQ/CobB/MinD/ParA nucleotide binding domain-containing protein [Candidatus Electrothrix aarhusensis]|uniref:CobQ/CobB/MinD/ParA nucleotide binding domain-containing protein n=1 Tax=Candidatus Electrothrix aarhusensis TaxID=1859131 RepID=A0A3S3QIQ1_9BACT|nr:CobQ/CobB/MinD/ParA nucleotide binding domain-containing protein [Candidatus Electrothrix aarhusensis]